MIDFENKTSLEFDAKNLYEIYNLLTNKDIEVILTTNYEIQKINKEYRNIDKPTDVLSFPLENLSHTPLGSIVISVDMAKEYAKLYKHSIEDEITLLFLHGLLHLLGYDHEIDDKMQQKEEEIIEKLNLPNSLIIRNENVIVYPQ